MVVQVKHDCKIELHKVALKATPARLATLKVLEAASKPLDVATIKSKLKKDGINADPATIFRMMNSFSDKGLVREINLQESKLRYEYSAKEDHHHLLCESCGSIEDISDCNIETWEKELREKKGFMIKHHSLEFFGLCKNCQKLI
ncbi:transcriptional repressor [Candidatus Daviesbacteria bacterium]|nr:transcriptional repressor [Candidatus Daviesbacteria bacterium]